MVDSKGTGSLVAEPLAAITHDIASSQLMGSSKTAMHMRWWAGRHGMRWTGMLSAVSCDTGRIIALLEVLV